jgi:hypothetical protein
LATNALHPHCLEVFIPIITIQNTVIDFPDSGNSPNWAPAVIAFAVATQNALSGIVGPADVPPQTFALDTFNPGTSVNIPNLTFSTAIVRSAFIRYSVFRTTSTTTLSEAGTLTITYNPSNPTGSLWETSRVAVGNAQITFYVTDAGQVQFTTAMLGGLNHTGSLEYSASAALQA